MRTSFVGVNNNILYKSSRDNKEMSSYVHALSHTPHSHKYTHTHIYTYVFTLYLSCLIYKSESWTLGITDEEILEGAEMSFLRYLAGYSKLDIERNIEIQDKLKAKGLYEQMKGKLGQCQHKTKDTSRRDSTSVPGTIDPGRSGKRKKNFWGWISGVSHQSRAELDRAGRKSLKH